MAEAQERENLAAMADRVPLSCMHSACVPLWLPVPYRRTACRTRLEALRKDRVQEAFGRDLLERVTPFVL